MSESKGFGVDLAIQHLQRIQMANGSRPCRLTIRKFNPGGLTAHQTTEVSGVYGGIDWQSGQAVIEPVKPLTELSAEDVEAIRKSVKDGQSWHAYKAQESLRARIKELTAELERLKSAA